MEQDNNLREITSQSTEITKSSATVLSDIRGAVDENAKSLTAAINLGKTLLANSQKVEEMNDELDKQLADYIKRSTATVSVMKERRKKITQIFDLVKSGFTRMESMLDKKSVDSIPYKLQLQRDKYAAYKVEQQRKAEEERKRLARVEAQKGQVAIDTKAMMSDIITIMSKETVNNMNALFDSLTLDNEEETRTKLVQYPVEISLAKRISIAMGNEDDSAATIAIRAALRITYNDIDADTIKAIRNETFKNGAKELERQYYETVSSCKQELMDRFDSKVEELREKKRAEEERRRAEEERRKAEEERRKAEEEARRKAEEAKRIADEEQRRKAEEEAKKAREEAERKAESERKAREEAERVEAERRAREEEVRRIEEEQRKEQQRKLEEEQKRREEQMRIESAQAQTQSLFDQAPSAISSPKVKVSHHIEITAPNAFIDIIQTWWTHEGSKSDVEELCKKLSFMIKACEKLCDKKDIKIDSPYIKYVEDIQAK